MLEMGHHTTDHKATADAGKICSFNIEQADYSKPRVYYKSLE